MGCVTWRRFSTVISLYICNLCKWNSMNSFLSIKYYFSFYFDKGIMPFFNLWNINNQSKRKYTCKDSLANSSIKFNMITPPSEITHQCIVYEKRIFMLHVVLLNKALFVDKCIHVLNDMRERTLSARNAGNSSFPKVDCILTLSEIHIWFLQSFSPMGKPSNYRRWHTNFVD